MEFGLHKVVINGQSFISTKKWPFNKNNVSIPKPLYVTSYSSLFVDENSFYKLIKTKSAILRGYRILLGRSRAKPEILGNKTLKEYGFIVPQLEYHGVSLWSKIHNEVLIYERLHDFITVKSAITNSKNGDEIKELLFRISEHLNLLISNGIYFKDFHFENVMVNSSMDICWVDTGVRFIRSKKKMVRLVNKQINTLAQDIKQGGWVNEGYWQVFVSNINFSSP